MFKNVKKNKKIIKYMLYSLQKKTRAASKIVYTLLKRYLFWTAKNI